MLTDGRVKGLVGVEGSVIHASRRRSGRCVTVSTAHNRCILVVVDQALLTVLASPWKETATAVPFLRVPVPGLPLPVPARSCHVGASAT
jgi:hypothetical protein